MKAGRRSYGSLAGSATASIGRSRAAILDETIFGGSCLGVPCCVAIDGGGR